MAQNLCGLGGSLIELSSQIGKIAAKTKNLDNKQQKFLLAIKQLKNDTYKNVPNDQFIDSTITLCNKLSKLLSTMGFNITENDIRATFTTTKNNSSQELPSKEEDLLKDIFVEDYFEDTTSSFINSVYGTSTAKNKMLGQLSTIIIDSILYNTTGEVTSNAQANRELISAQENLYSDIVRLLKLEKAPKTLFNEDGSNNLDKLNKELQSHKKYFNPAELQRFSRDTTPTGLSRMRLYNSIFILNHFDRLLINQLKGMVDVTISEGIPSNDIKKYLFKLTNLNKVSSWRSDDHDIDSAKEVSHIVKLILQSMPIWRGDTVTPEFINFNNVITLNNFIKTLVNHPVQDIDISKLSEQSKSIIGTSTIGRKKLSDLINQAIDDQGEALRNLWTVLSDPNFPYSTYNINKRSQLLIQSLYRNIFDSDNSLYSLYLESINNANVNIEEEPLYLYHYITQFLATRESIESQQYVKESNEINSNTLKESQTKNQTRRVDDQISGHFSVNRAVEYRSVEVNHNYQKTIDSDESPEMTITFTGKDGVDYNIKSGKTKIEYYKNGKPFIPENKDIENISHVLEEITRFKFDKPFIDALSEISNTAGKELFNFINNIIKHFEISKILKDKKTTLKDYKDYLLKFFDKEPGIKKGIKQLQATNDKDTNIKINLVVAYDTLHKINRETVQKDSDNKQISPNGLDQIATKAPSQWDRVSKENSVIKNFQALKIYNGQEFSRDYKSTDVNKTATKFTESENFISTFMYDYLSNIYGENSKIVKILPTIISDKSRILKTRFDFKQYLTLPDGTRKQAYKLTTSEWQSLTKSELSQYYNLIYDLQIEKYKQLSNQLSTIFGEDFVIANNFNFDITTNFINFNNILDKYNTINNTNITPSQVLHQCILEIQKTNPSFELKDILDYNITRDGVLQGNDLLIDQVYRWDSSNKIQEETYNAYNLQSGYGNSEEFFKTKQAQFISDLITNRAEILLSDVYGNAFTGKSFSNISKEWKSYDNVIFAKLYYQGLNKEGTFVQKTLNITDKQSFKDSYIYKRIQKYKRFIYQEPAEQQKLSVDSPTFDINKFAEAITIYNRQLHSPQTYIGRIKKAIRQSVPSEVLEILLSEIEPGLTVLDKLVTEKVLNKAIKDKKLSFTKKSLVEIGLPIDFNESISDVFDFSSITLNKIPSNNVTILEMNPELEKYQATEYYLSSEYVNATVGSHINHPASGGSLREKEATAWGQQVKRNVALTASKYKFGLNLVDGIKNEYTVSVIEDDKAIISTIKGETQSTKPFDGATFCSGTTNYHENASLKGDHAGVDKKQFVHDYDPKTGTGLVVKTAGFAITNGRLRNSITLQNLNKKMLDIVFNEKVDITKNFNGGRMFNTVLTKEGPQYETPAYGDIVYREIDSEGNPHIYRTIHVQYISGNNAYIFREELTENGWEKVPHIEANLNSNYSIWEKVFGGMNSITLNIEDINSATLDTSWEYSENSFRQLAFAQNYVGDKLVDGLVIQQSDVYQPLKKHVIDYIITAGAIKQGAANINSKAAYYDPNYKLTTMTLRMYDAGIQLDAEHTADEAKLSLMTQVLNVLGARGYSAQDAAEVYEAIRGLTQDIIQDQQKGDFDAEMQSFLTDVILESIKTSKETDGDLFAALATTVKKKYQSGDKITYELIRKTFPISNPAIFEKIISQMASVITKACVRIKFPGTLSVLSPSNGLYKLYNGKLLSYYNGQVPELGLKNIGNNISKITFGATYKITYTNNKSEIVLIDDPATYYRIQSSKIKKIEEVLNEGRDLASYNFTFTDDSGEIYCMWDLDSVKSLSLDFNLFKGYIRNNNEKGLSELLEKYQFDGELKDFHKYLIGRLQHSLNSVSNGQVVWAKGKQVSVSNLDIKPYELIMSKLYKTTFGLRNGDDIENIVNDKYFFVKRSLQNYTTKTHAVNYDLELKSVNGEHTYLLHSNSTMPSSLSKKEIKTVYDEGKLYQVDYLTNTKIRELSSDSDEIYVDQNGIEVIVTSDFNHYINTTNFIEPHFSEGITDNKVLKQIIYHLSQVDNDSIQDLLDQYFTAEEFNSILEGKDVSMDNLIDKIEEIEGLYKKDLLLLKTIDDSSIDMLNTKLGQRFVKNNLEVHTSFQKSLEVLAARIPAQSHQSFMAMKVVGFDESGLNTAYVSRMQIYLQGSDFDIDKVSLLGYKIKNGKFIKWSPLMDLSSIHTLKASELLPFPTGKSLEISNKVDSEFEFLVNNYLGALTSGEKIKQLAYIIKYVNKLGFIPKNPESNKLQKLIEKHNQYFKNRPKKDALINFVSSRMFRISSDPINLIQGQSGVDEGVDIIKNNAKKQPSAIKSKLFAPGSPWSKVSQLILTLQGKENTGIVASAMKNFEACSQRLYEVLAEGSQEEINMQLFNINIAGKNLKLLANAYTKNASRIKNEDVKQALKEVDNYIDAFLQFSSLLSLSTDNAKDPTLSKINAGPTMIGLYTSGLMIGLDLDTLITIITSKTGWDFAELMTSNVFNNLEGCFDISAVLRYNNIGPTKEYDRLPYKVKKHLEDSVKLWYSTFNPTYLEELQEVQKVKSIADIQLPVQQIMKVLSNKNFNLSKAFKQRGKNTHKKELEDEKNKIDSLAKIEKSKLEEKRNQILSNIILINTDSNLDDRSRKRELKRLNALLSNIDDYLAQLNALLEGEDSNPEFIEQLQEKIRIEQEIDDGYDIGDYNDHTKKRVYKFIKAVKVWRNYRQRWKYDKVVINNEEYSPIEILNTLNQVSREQSWLRPVLANNQSLPNSPEEQLSFMRNFENIFMNRLDDFSGDGVNVLEQLQELNGQNADNNKVNLNRFVTDENYRNSIIKLYDQIKAAVNIFDVMANAKHYFGYLEALNKLINAQLYGSVIYKALNEVSKNIISPYYKGGKQHNKFMKSTKRFFTKKINDYFMLSHNPVITITTDTVYLENNTSIPFDHLQEISIVLGTPAGNATFKHWFEEIFIPTIQNDYRYADNDFIQNLTKISTSLTYDKNVVTNLGLPDNMMPKSESEREVVKNYKDQLARLKDKTYSGIPVVSLVFYYNLIAYNGQSGQNSFTALFEDLFAERSDDTVSAYNEFLSLYDKEGEIKEGTDYSENELLEYIADTESLEKAKLKYSRIYNTDTMEYILVERKERSKETSIQEDDDVFGLDQEYNSNEDLVNSNDNDPENQEGFEDTLKRSKYRKVESPRVLEDFMGVSTQKTTRHPLSGSVSIIFKTNQSQHFDDDFNELKNNIDKIVIKRKSYTIDEILQLARNNGYGNISIEQLLITKKIIVDKQVVTTFDSELTASYLEQITEENC